MPCGSPRAASWERAGMAAVATERPKSPIGRYITRKAKFRHDAAPSPWLVASMVLTRMLICTAASAIVPGPISTRTSRSRESRQSMRGRKRNPSRRRPGH